MTIKGGNGAAKATQIGRPAAQTFPKRFYKAATVEAAPGGFALLLDGRGARTPARSPLVVPSRALADALAAEWGSVGETVDPRAMPLTRLVNTVIDGVRLRQAEVLAEINRFAASDLLVYRAGGPADLVRAQQIAWDPLVEWADQSFGAPLTLTEGVVHVSQPPEVLRSLERALASLVGDDAASPYRIAALHVMTTLTGSALLAAAVAAGHVTPEEAWSAAHVDEDHQISLWGEDAEATARREARWREMRAASAVYRFVEIVGQATSQVVARSTK